MLVSPIRGRPYGGRAFIINKNVKVIKYEFINKYLAVLVFISNNCYLCNIYTYMPYDDNSQLSLSEYQSCLQIIVELSKFYSSKNYMVFILGDFNADLLRGKRFDNILLDFVSMNEFEVISPSYDPQSFTYIKGDYTANLDHCIVLKNSISNYFSKVIDNDINLSDHKPVFINYFISVTSSHINNDLDISTNDLPTIKLSPNFDNEEINLKFNVLLMKNMNNYVIKNSVITSDHQIIINDMYKQLITSISSAYDSCSRIASVNSIMKNKKWFTSELKQLKYEIILLRSNITAYSREKIKSLQKTFKRIMKRNIFLYEKNEYFKIDKLIRERNGDAFFKKVKKISNLECERP